MSELKIGDVGRVNGHVVKCVSRNNEINDCEQCVLNNSQTCLDTPCGKWLRTDKQFVKFITPTSEEVSEFEAKEGEK